MCDDRTSEFLSLARGLPGASNTPSFGAGSSSFLSSQTSPLLSSSSAVPANGSLGGGSSSAGAATSSEHSQAKNNPAYAELRNFHKTAGEISRDIAATSALLQELAHLVRHKSLFEDDSARVNQLVVRIKGSIENLNSRLDQAGHVIQQQKRVLGKHSQAGQEAANLVDGLKTEFAEAAGSFKKVLQQRTDNMKETDEMQRKVYGNDGGDPGDHNPIPNMSALGAPPPVYSSSSLSGGGAPASFPTLDLTSGMMSAGEATGSGPPSSSLPRPHGIVTGPSSAPNLVGMDGSDLPTYSGAYSSYSSQQQRQPLTPLDIQRMEEESGGGRQMQLIPDQDYLRERADAMSQVETSVVELGTIFNKLATLVSEHQGMVQRVEDNVDEANVNVNLAMQTLTDTLTNLRTNKGLALRVFGVLVLFIIMFIVFFA